jgi:hypothetical protein
MVFQKIMYMVKINMSITFASYLIGLNINVFFLIRNANIELAPKKFGADIERLKGVGIGEVGSLSL